MDYYPDIAFDKFCKNYNPKNSTLGSGKLIVFYGPPCSGKTTLSKIIARHFYTHRISLDLLRVEYFQGRQLFTEQNNTEVFNLFVRIISFLIDCNQSVVCEGFFISQVRRQQVLNIRSDACFIYCTALLETLNQRLVERHKVVVNSEDEYASILQPEELKKFYHASKQPENHNSIIVSDVLSIQDCIKKSIDIINTHFQLNEYRSFLDIDIN